MKDFPHFTEEKLHIFDDLPSGVLVNTENDEGGFEYAYSNEFLASSLGYTRDELKTLLRENCYALIYEADREKTGNARSRVINGEVVDSISRQRKKDGSFVWILAHIRQVYLDDKKALIFLFSDIQKLIGLQNELSKKSDAWEDIVQSVPIGLLIYREERGVRTTLSVNRFLLDFANSAGMQMDEKHRDWTEAEISMILNHDIYAFCENEDIENVAEMVRKSETEPQAACIFRLRGSATAKNVYIYAACVSKKIGDDSFLRYVTYQNVTEKEKQRKELVLKQEELYRLSYYDALTKVKNRNAFNDFASVCKTKPISNVGIVFFDINGLKNINDSLGHKYGDKLIKYFVSILLKFYDAGDVYRMSGDEFVVICQNVSHDSFQTNMKKLTASIKDEGNLASVGYVWKEKVSDLSRRTSQAEQIMYVEKQNYYEQSRTVSSKHRPRMLDSMLKEFDEGRFIMYLQPKTAIDGSRVIGAEALVRKMESDGRIILPYAFVPQLEYEMLIPKLDFFMLDQACSFLEKMHRKGNDDFSVSANISRITIVENDFLSTVESILNKYDFEKKNIELELTESNKTMDSTRLEEYLISLKKLGVKISLDDMGNEYSTINMLTLEGFDWIKLDRSLIMQLNQPKARILIRNIVNTCHELGLKVIAEGVETDEERVLLMNMNCDAYQGYLKSKPIPVREFEDRFL